MKQGIGKRLAADSHPLHRERQRFKMCKRDTKIRVSKNEKGKFKNLKCKHKYSYLKSTDQTQKHTNILCSL